jgi:hypothetical protein
MVLLGVFLLGCGASGVASRYVVPVAHADVPPHRWEYHCIRANEDVSTLANQYGQQGWEMAAATTGSPPGTFGTTMIWCFKRPLP